MLKPLDVLVLLKLVVYGNTGWTYHRLAHDLGISPSQLHTSVKRCVASRLLEASESPRPLRSQIKEFMIHGVKYCFPADYGGLTRGIPTAYAAPPLNQLIASSNDPPPVWPYAMGKVRGMMLSPIHKAAPEAASQDEKLYLLLALLDALRTGRAREREIATRELIARIG
jgi:hypothetical protein